MKKTKDIKILRQTSLQEVKAETDLLSLFSQCPIPKDEILSNLPLFIKRQDVSRLLFLNELYQKILNVHGNVVEFGCRWGRQLSMFAALRGIYEPYNYNRKIVGFDTFSGFPSVHKKDGSSDIIKRGSYGVTDQYEKYLQKILESHEKESPLAHLSKFEILKGNAPLETKKYLMAHPETIIALAYFDFDLYEPTKKCLELIKEHLTRGSVLVFDELNHPDFPGETVAVKEILGLKKYKIQHSPYSTVQAYVVIE